MIKTTLPVGCKIKFANEKRPYTIRASNDRFAICTKPFYIINTVIYTIIDLQRGVRGTEGTVFCTGFESDQDCQDALERLTTGETQVSHRNFVPLETFTIYRS